MKITFLIHASGTSVGGGVKVVFEYANRLTERGHDVKIIYPLVNSESKLKSIINITRFISPFHDIYPKWFNLKATLLPVPTFKEKYIPKADIIVATWWKTAYSVSTFEETKGEKFYLIQHYETWGGPEEDVKRTYNLGLHNVVISNWIKKKIKSIGANVDDLILNGVNFDEFYPDKKNTQKDKIRILMPYRLENWKGVEDGLKAFEIIKEKCNNVMLVMFGPKPKKGELNDCIEFHSYPTGEKLKDLYNSCDIFLFPSRCEGFGLPPIEAMACKLPVVTTDVGAVKDYTLPGKTALVSKPLEPHNLAKNAIKLIENENLRNEIAEAGYEYVKQFNWNVATDKLENLFKNYIEVE